MTREEKKEVGQQMKRDIMRGLSDCYRKGSGQYDVVKKMLSKITLLELNSLWCMVTTLHKRERDVSSIIEKLPSQMVEVATDEKDI